MTLIPAYIILFVPTKSLESLEASSEDSEPYGLLARALVRLGRFSNNHGHFILVTAVVLLVVAAWGITRIEVNDNPTKWFTQTHEIRVADRVLNKHFGGTYTAYLEFDAPQVDRNIADIHRDVMLQLEATNPNFADEANAVWQSLNDPDFNTYFTALNGRAQQQDEALLGSWQTLGDAIAYSEARDLASLTSELQALDGVAAEDRQVLLQRLAGTQAMGDALLDEALAVVDQQSADRLVDRVADLKLSAQAPGFKQPELLRWIADLQAHLHEHPMVGKTTSLVDALQKANYELNFDAAKDDAANQANYSVPTSVAATGQVFAQLESTKRKDSIFHLVTRDYTAANLWLQLKSGDNRDMEAVVREVEHYLAANPAPIAVNHDWAGLTYLNVIWQEKMVSGMLSSLMGSFVVVLIMMMLLFRSILFGILAMLPLSLTIALIYGIIGLVGKDYDMPVAVLSALTLGLSVDFAIHFLQRSREAVQKYGSWAAARASMFREPAVAISRNAITIAIGFTPLLVAPLVPYQTVGFFLATIMLVSWMATLKLLPAMLKLLSNWLFPTAKSTPSGQLVEG
jgi:predicted RND superfamily exporter protein